MRKFAVVTGTRADYGIYSSILAALAEQPGMCFELLACGAHLSDGFGKTVDAIVADGHPIGARIETLEEKDDPAAIARGIARAISGCAAYFETAGVDMLIVLGDRLEMFAAAAAALPFMLPVAHIHGGERTEGVVDEAARHSITKMSHIHFASLPDYARRIVQLGEDPNRVHVSGAPALDMLAGFVPLPTAELEARIGMKLARPPVLITYHPATLAYRETERDVAMVLDAVANIDRPLIFTAPNADTFGSRVLAQIQAFCMARDNATFIHNLGSHTYFSLMSIAAAMLGNSSSGIIEAPSFALPVVNLGDRQRGRYRAANVLDVPCDGAAIAAALDRCLTQAFRDSLRGMENPYGDGKAAERIIEVLRRAELNRALLAKRFYDLSITAAV